MNDSIIIIDAYLNNIDKIELFNKVFLQVKKLNLPIMLVSNILPPISFIENVDHFLFINKNLLFKDFYTKYPEVSFFMGTDWFRYENNIKCFQKHGLSVISNLKTCSKYAEELGYKKFIRIEWDFIIHDDEISIIKKLIDDFIVNDKKAFFIYNPINCSKLPDLCYHFWMVDLKFWNDNFPSIHNEIDYKIHLKNLNDQDFFETAERILYLSFFKKLTIEEYIDQSAFEELFNKSTINYFINDINFDLPSSNGVCCGLCRVVKNGFHTDELRLFTWNRNSTTPIERNYQISYNDVLLEYKHSVICGFWQIDFLPQISIKDFPIKLKVIGQSEHIYNDYSDLNSSVIVDKNC